jgi:hypothetical protein
MKYRSILVAVGLCCAQGVFSETVSNHHHHGKLPLFTEFDWTMSTAAGYSISGKICNTIAGVGPVGCGPATFVFDPINQRMLIDLGSNGGTYYILSDGSYVDGAIPGAPCQQSSRTFSDQLAGYQQVLSMPHSRKSKERYFGRASDVTGCSDTIGAEFIVQSKRGQRIITQFNFSQMYPLGDSCSAVTGSLVLDPKTVDFYSDTSAYFDNMPDSCNSDAPYFCDTVYYPGNSCSPDALKKVG